MACCDASASVPGGVVGCAFGVAVAEAFDRVSFVVVVVELVVGLVVVVVVVGVAVVESVAVFASSAAAVEIAGVEGGAEWEERLAVAVLGSGTAPE